MVVASDRPVAGGVIDRNKLPRWMRALHIIPTSLYRAKWVRKEDGRPSRRSRGNMVRSGVIGWWKTKWHGVQPTKWTQRNHQMVSSVDWDFYKLCSYLSAVLFGHDNEAWHEQQQFAKKVGDCTLHKGWFPFTTVTVNRNFRTALHNDIHNLANSMSLMVVAKLKEYQGCELLIPEKKWRIDVKEGDVVMMDRDLLHCNSEFMTTGCRISMVFYCREDLVKI